MSSETFSSEKKLFPHHIIEVLDQRDRLRYPVLNGKQITDLVKKKVDVSSTIAGERIAEMRKEGKIEFSELGYNQFVYWLPDEQIIKREPLDKWRSRTLTSLNQVVTISVGFLLLGLTLASMSMIIDFLAGDPIFNVVTWNFVRLCVALVFLCTFFRQWAYLVRNPHIGQTWGGTGSYKNYGRYTSWLMHRCMWIKYQLLWIRNLILISFGRDAGGSPKIFTRGIKTGPSSGGSVVLFGLVLYGFGVVEMLPSQGWWALVGSGVGLVGVVLFFYAFSKVSERASKMISPIVIQSQGVDSLTGTEQEMINGI